MRKFLGLVLVAVRAAMMGIAGALERIARLFGGGGSPVPTPPATLPSEEITEEYADAYEREAAADQATASDLGHAVHQYASADDPGVRCAVDLGGLSRSQMDWLLGLKDEDLRRLAQAGPRVCERAVSGKRSGIIGLPTVAIENAAHEAISGPHPVKDFLVNRVRSARARRAELLA